MCGAHGRNTPRPALPGRVSNYLVPRWQQCWFSEQGGRWRTLDDTLHYSVLVVQVEATSLDLAGAIAPLCRAPWQTPTSVAT
ncbi:MAG TPA: hypothetical protein VNI78_07055 [Vicinamibacterales bacterium]|nr:hypothetical protein [Vicinamibacterales bacterium]